MPGNTPISPGTSSLSNAHTMRLPASTRKLLDLVAREQVALVIFGHDGEQWQRLKLAPDDYD
jgi:hypothetical protein